MARDRSTRRISLPTLTFVLMALLATGLWAWSHGLNGPYHFDDYVTPLDDPASQSLAAWVQHVPHTLRPVTKLTYAVEAETSRTSAPAARRVVSIVLHAISAGLLLLLIRRLAPGAPLYWSVALAAIWFLHPVHADAVLLASGRSAALSNLLVIAALVAIERSRLWYATLLFALAVLSRETTLAALLPMVVLALARSPAGLRTGIRQLLPLAAAAVFVTWWLLTTPRYLQLAEYSMLGRPIAHSAIAQVGAVPVGLWLLIQPAALSIDYGLPLPVSIADPLFVAGVLLYLGAAVGVLVCLHRSPAAAVGLALWLAALLPTQSVIPKLDALTNRPLSLALAGLLIACASITPRRWLVPVSGATAVLVVVLLVGATASRAQLFQSELRLWQHAADKSRVNERPHLQYALLLQQAGRDLEAMAAMSVAAGINPLSSQVEALSRNLEREVEP